MTTADAKLLSDLGWQAWTQCHSETTPAQVQQAAVAATVTTALASEAAERTHCPAKSVIS